LRQPFHGAVSGCKAWSGFFEICASRVRLLGIGLFGVNLSQAGFNTLLLIIESDLGFVGSDARRSPKAVDFSLSDPE
jgi:hypothetical protein